MTALISGSVAIDTLLASPFPFELDASQVDAKRLAVSYFMPDMRQVWGGCAANIAYALKQLGGDPLVLATVGDDDAAYRQRFAALGLRSEGLKTIAGTFTAKAVIMSDNLGQQITGFHPGAMGHAHAQTIASVLTTKHHLTWGIVSPDGKEAMLQRCAELKALKIPFIADPGQALPILDASDLRTMIDGASLIAVNEHEAVMMASKLGKNASELSHSIAVLETLGDKGLNFWQVGQCTHIAAIAGVSAVDPTGCGDSLRGAVLYALTLGWSWLDALRLGNLMGAHVVQSAGAQTYTINLGDLKALWVKHYPEPYPTPAS